MNTIKGNNSSLFYIVAGILTLFGLSLYLHNNRKKRINQLDKELDNYVRNPWVGFDKLNQDFKAVGNDMNKAIKKYEKESIQF